jgi:hypothetical protein
MAVLKQFDRKLADLWHHRIANVESLVRKRVGKPKSFTVKRRDKGIKDLEALADKILTKQGAKKELAKITSYTRRHHIRGHGVLKRGGNMLSWAGNLPGIIVYSFWRGNRCLYVGKGGKWTRLKGYEKSVYVKEATVVKVRGITSKSFTGRAECLSKHLYKPRDNKIEPAKGKWSKACPVCKAKKQLRTNLRTLFKMK